jgi:acyl transferase domain-containing protein
MPPAALPSIDPLQLLTLEAVRAFVVLKRLADAERDGDRVYAVIKGIAGSSDGRGKGLTAPRTEGQAFALDRAYAKAGFGAETVHLMEATGPGPWPATGPRSRR